MVDKENGVSWLRLFSTGAVAFIFVFLNSSSRRLECQGTLCWVVVVVDREGGGYLMAGRFTFFIGAVVIFVILFVFKFSFKRGTLMQ